MKTYRTNEIFYSLQGEGIRAGTPNVFVRFSGCNLTCRAETHGFDCDTEFVSGRAMTAEDINRECRRITERTASRTDMAMGWIIFTGGEPGLQLDPALCSFLHSEGWCLAVETNGSIELPTCCDHHIPSEEHSRGCFMLDWITVSPKVAEHAIRQRWADEVKYVRGHGQGIPKPTCDATHRLISPAFNGNQVDPEALAWCIALVRDNPDWRLSVQQHKGWLVR